MKFKSKACTNCRKRQTTPATILGVMSGFLWFNCGNCDSTMILPTNKVIAETDADIAMLNGTK